MLAERGGQNFNLGLVSIFTSSEIHSTYIGSGPVAVASAVRVGGRFGDGRGRRGVYDATDVAAVPTFGHGLTIYAAPFSTLHSFAQRESR